MKHITVLAFPRALGTSITLPVEMLNAADAHQRIQNPGSPRLTIDIASIDAEYTLVVIFLTHYYGQQLMG